MQALEIISHKRDGEEHTAAEIEFLLSGYLSGDVPDYQMAAWLMSVCIRGMTRAETLALTEAMVRSGEVLDLSSIQGVKVDKHSTGESATRSPSSRPHLPLPAESRCQS